MSGQKEKYHDRRGRPDEIEVEKVIRLSNFERRRNRDGWH